MATLRPRLTPAPERIDTLADFKREVDRIDWWACMSDDFSVASSGEAHHRRVYDAIQRIGPDAEAYYNSKCPYDRGRR